MADMVADMDKVADMEVDMVADINVETILTRIHNFASQICIQCKWRQLVAKFATNANGATIW